VIEVTTETAQDTLLSLADDLPRRRRLGANGQQAWASGRGAVDRSIALVRQHLRDVVA
jgi:hypothetical protein